MTTYLKVAGAWVPANRIYIKKSGAWVPADRVYVKRSGSWQLCHAYDVTPPAVPLISLQIITTTYTESKTIKVGQYIKIGVRSPGVSHDPELKRIRVLSTYNGHAPTTQFGGTYTSAPDDNYPNEPWSDYQFNGFSGSSTTKDSSQYHYKTWPRNASSSTQLEGGKTYHFTAWSEDLYGNWSNANAASIFVPKLNVDGASVVSKEARFQATAAGTFASSGYTSGDLVQKGTPKSAGLYMYGSQMIDSIGEAGTPTISKAQIYIPRQNDNGSNVSNVYLAWHAYGTPSALPGSFDSVTHTDTQKVGTINNGEAKWFDLPDEMVAALEAGSLKGFTLWYKDPNKAAPADNDFTKVKSLATNIRSGELHVVWSEQVGPLTR